MPPIPIAVARTTAIPPRARIVHAPPREGPWEGRHGGKAGKAGPKKGGGRAPRASGEAGATAGYVANLTATIGWMGEPPCVAGGYWAVTTSRPIPPIPARSEEHTSELQSHHDLV